MTPMESPWAPQNLQDPPMLHKTFLIEHVYFYIFLRNEGSMGKHFTIMHKEIFDDFLLSK